MSGRDLDLEVGVGVKDPSARCEGAAGGSLAGEHLPCLGGGRRLGAVCFWML